jgi:hypothetical protein
MRFLAAAPPNHDTFRAVEATIAQCTTKPREIGRTKRWAAGRALGTGFLLEHWWESLVPSKSEEASEDPGEVLSECGVGENSTIRGTGTVRGRTELRR